MVQTWWSTDITGTVSVWRDRPSNLRKQMVSKGFCRFLAIWEDLKPPLFLPPSHTSLVTPSLSLLKRCNSSKYKLMTIIQSALRETGIISQVGYIKTMTLVEILKFPPKSCIQKASIFETSPFKSVHVPAHTWTGMSQLYEVWLMKTSSQRSQYIVFQCQDHLVFCLCKA